MKHEQYSIATLLGVDHFQQFMHCYQQNEIYKCQFEVAASEILTPAGLEEIINSRRLTFPRCRLVRSGKPIPPAEYNERSHSAMGEGIIKLIPLRVMQEIESGATLALDFAEDLSTTIRAVAESLSFFFRKEPGRPFSSASAMKKGLPRIGMTATRLFFN